MNAPATWQPIETAPKDGTCVVAYSLPHLHCGVVFSNDQGEWELAGLHGNGMGVGFYPTHWMPLPPPPEPQP